MGALISDKKKGEAMKLNEFLKALSNEITVGIWEEQTDAFLGAVKGDNPLLLDAVKDYTVVWFKPESETVLDVVVRKEED